MAVKVIHPLLTSMSTSRETAHDEATSIAINDGHLFVQKQARGDTVTVAIYSPGQWITANVETGAST